MPGDNQKALYGPVNPQKKVKLTMMGLRSPVRQAKGHGVGGGLLRKPQHQRTGRTAGNGNLLQDTCAGAFGPFSASCLLCLMSVLS